MPVPFNHLARRMNRNLEHWLCMVAGRLMVVDLLKEVSVAV